MNILMRYFIFSHCKSLKYFIYLQLNFIRNAKSERTFQLNRFTNVNCLKYDSFKKKLSYLNLNFSFKF